MLGGSGAAGMTNESVEGSPTKKIKSASVRRLHNWWRLIKQVILGYDENNEVNYTKEIPAGEEAPIWFMEFCDQGDYNEIVSGSKITDLNNSGFDLSKLCQLVKEEGTSNLEADCLCSGKERTYRHGKTRHEKTRHEIKDPSDENVSH